MNPRGRNRMRDGIAAYRALHEALGAVVNFPHDDAGQQFAALVMTDTTGTLRRIQPHALGVAALAYAHTVVVAAAREAGMSEAELWRRVAALVDRIEGHDDD